MIPSKPHGVRGLDKDVVVIGSGECLEVFDRARYAPYSVDVETRVPDLRRALATLLDMTYTHIPVLAGELIDITDPHPGEVAVDCTFGAAVTLASSRSGSAPRGR